jgi:hypothetical protein
MDNLIDIRDLVLMINIILGDETDTGKLRLADLDSNSTVDIRDLIQLINLILDKKSSNKTFGQYISSGQDNIQVLFARDTLNNSTEVYIQNNGEIAGIQIGFDSNVEPADISQAADIETFEFVVGTAEQTDLTTILLYSLENQTLGVGRHKLFTIESDLTAKSITECLISDSNGNALVYTLSDSIIVVDGEQITNSVKVAKNDDICLEIYPNPTNGTLNLEFYLEMPENIVIDYISYSGKLLLRKNIQGIRGKNIHELEIKESGFLRLIQNSGVINKKIFYY